MTALVALVLFLAAVVLWLEIFRGAVSAVDDLPTMEHPVVWEDDDDE